MSCVVDGTPLGDLVCPPDFNPVINSDVSGIGVRVSFYLQALLLACLSARARSLDEITGALYTLIATNMAMAVTSLILGFKPSPTLSFHDSLIVFYLLALSWASVFFSLPTYNRFVKSDKTLQLLSIIQSYLLFAYAIAILIKARTFGPSFCCNQTARVVLFRPFSALHAGRIVGWIVVMTVVTVYTFLCVYDYWPLAKRWYKRFKDARLGIPSASSEKRKEKDVDEDEDEDEESDGSDDSAPGDDPEAANNGRGNTGGTMGVGTTGRSAQRTPQHERDTTRRHRGTHGDQQRDSSQKKRRHAASTTLENRLDHGYDLGLAGNLIIELIVIGILWALMVMNTELMIVWNNFQESTDWQFGQILPMFLIVLPLINTFKAYTELGFKRRRHNKKAHKNKAPHAPRTDNPFGNPFTSPFSFNPFVSQYANPMGGQPSARISAHSIHSIHSEASKEGSERTSSHSGHSTRSNSPGRINNSGEDSDDDLYASEPGPSPKEPDAPSQPVTPTNPHDEQQVDTPNNPGPSQKEPDPPSQPMTLTTPPDEKQDGTPGPSQKDPAPPAQSTETPDIVSEPGVDKGKDRSDKLGRSPEAPTPAPQVTAPAEASEEPSIEPRKENP